jgi:hypothetical protein
MAAPLLGAPGGHGDEGGGARGGEGFCAKGKKPAGTENQGPYVTNDPVALRQNHFFLNRANDRSNYPTSCMGAGRGADKDFGSPLATPTIELPGST